MTSRLFINDALCCALFYTLKSKGRHCVAIVPLLEKFLVFWCFLLNSCGVLFVNESEFWMNHLPEWTDFWRAYWMNTLFTEQVDGVLNLKPGHHILNKDFGCAQIVCNEPIKWFSVSLKTQKDLKKTLSNLLKESPNKSVNERIQKIWLFGWIKIPTVTKPASQCAYPS